MVKVSLNARQRAVIKIVLIGAAALLLLGLILDAAAESSYPAFSVPSLETVYRLNSKTGRYEKTSRPDKHVPARFDAGEFLSALLRSPRLYAAGFLIGLAVVIHHGGKEEK